MSLAPARRRLTLNRLSSRCKQSYTSSAINSRRSVVDCRPHLPSLPCHRQVLSTTYRPLSLFITHSLTVGAPCEIFQVQSFGQSFRGKYPYFWRYPNFPKNSVGRGKLVRKNQLDPCSRLDTILACDRHKHTNIHTSCG